MENPSIPDSASNSILKVVDRKSFLSSSLICTSCSLLRIGWRSLSIRACLGPGLRIFFSGPNRLVSDITNSSLMASTGGLLTCAKICLK